MPGIFRAYDIRGIYGKDLTEDTALKIGQAFGTINRGTIAVGMDARLSGPSLKAKLIEGLVSTGCSVVDVGMITSPMMIFATGFYKYDGGIMVTASHNPKEYNGFKVFAKGAMPVSYESGLGSMEKLIAEGMFAKGKGRAEKKSIVEDYSKFVLGQMKFKQTGFKVVVDAGNGAAGKINAGILRRAGFDVVELYCNPDGNFPNHQPDPSEPENVEDLCDMVQELDADLGLAFDGDGDRLGVIDKGGSRVGANDVFILLAKHALDRHPNGKIIINISCSMAVEDMVRKWGGVPVDCKVGHTYITEKMTDVGGAFAGELSGHFFFKEFFNGDDALLAGLSLLEFLINNKTSVKHEVAQLPKYFTEAEENIVIPVREEDKAPFMEKIKKDMKKRGFKILDIDGVKVLFDDGWLLFRPSNTTPLIRYGYESRTKEGFERIKKLAEEIKACAPK